MENDLISIVIPVYNAEQYLDQCIQSVINQTYKNIEIIMVNDGSNDNSKEIALQYKNLDHRIRYYDKEHSGCGATRNYGIDKAKGKYIYFLDSDDYIEPDLLEKLHKAIKPEDSFVGTITLYIESKSGTKIASRTEEEQKLFKTPSVCTRLYNKEILDKSQIRFSKAKIGEDLEFNFKLLVFNNHCSYIDEILYHYRINPKSTMHGQKIDKLSIFEAIDGIEEYVKQENKQEEFRDLLEFVNIVHVLYAVKNILLQDEYDVNDVNRGFEYLINKYPNWQDNVYVSTHFMKELVALRNIIIEKKYNKVI